MVQSHIGYARTYAACEAEDLQFTGLVQAGVSLLAAEGSVPVARTPDLAELSLADCEAILSAPVSSHISGTYRVVDAGSLGSWLCHDSGQATIFERSRSEAACVQPPKIDWAEIETRSKQNLWKLCFHLCDAVGKALNCERTMVYRFHEDFSGEVIAESLRGGLEPFLGLRYPPTDIPSTARALFLSASTRHIFSAVKSGQSLVPFQETGAATTPDTLDLSRAMGRSVSPYHLEYLRNMGTHGTAACALVFEGRLWGLLSLHFNRDRQPSLEEFSFLQHLNMTFLPLLEKTLHSERDELQQRSKRVLERQVALLEDNCDPFHTFLVSPMSLHHVLSGQGSSLVIGDEICNVGSTPDIAVTRAICQGVGATLAVSESAFLDKLPDEVAALNGGAIAGCAIIRLCDAPEAFAIVYRNALSQTVSWGGDPRQQHAAEESLRVSPRKSFETSSAAT